MFGSSRSGASAYAKVGLETGVVAASPHKLIVMLFEGAIAAVHTATAFLNDSQYEEKGKAISKACLIVNEGLRASLNKRAGGEIAANLDALYEYIVQILMKGNLRNDPAMLNEAVALLTELKEAWDSIDPAANAPTMQRPVAYDALAARPANFVSA